MIWLALAAAAAVFYAAQGGWTKRITVGVTPMVATWAIFGMSFPFLLLYLGVRGVPEVGTLFWPVVLLNSVLLLLSFYLYVSAIKLGELGLTYPLLALTPVLVVPVEWIILGDPASPRGFVGILLVTAGVYVLNFQGAGAPLLEPFRALGRDPGARRMLAVALIWSVTGTLDRVAVLEASAALYGVAISGILGLAFLPLAWRRRGAAGPGGAAADGPAVEAGAPHAAGGPGEGGALDATAGGKDAPNEDGHPPMALREALRRRPRALLVQGTLFAALFICQMEALKLALAAYVISIKRSGTLLTVLMATLFFGERHLGRRLAGTAVILVGVTLVATG